MEQDSMDESITLKFLHGGTKYGKEESQEEGNEEEGNKEKGQKESQEEKIGTIGM